MEGHEAKNQSDDALDEAMVLFRNAIQVFDLQDFESESCQQLEINGPGRLAYDPALWGSRPHEGQFHFSDHCPPGQDDPPLRRSSADVRFLYAQ